MGKNLMYLIAAFLFATNVFGFQSQATTGTIEGTVSDQTGAVLPGVNISLKSVETGVVRTLTTDDRGYFRAPLLPVGRYDVSADISGFSKFEQAGVTLTVGQIVNLPIRLSVSGRAETIAVSADVPVVEVTRTATPRSSGARVEL